MSKKLKNETPSAFDMAIQSVESQFGENIIRRGKDIKKEMLSTGIITLDDVLGGGYPKGKIIELFGKEGGGKTTLCLQACKNVMSRGGNVLYMDMEDKLDIEYARSIGVNIDKLYLGYPSGGEDALSIWRTFARLGAVDLIVIDSIAALDTLHEREGVVGKSHVGELSRLLGANVKTLAREGAATGVTVLAVNQIRDKISSFGYGGGGIESPGGHAIKFHAAVRIKTTMTERIKNGDNIIGIKIKIETMKNSMAPPFLSTFLDIYSSYGVSEYSDTINVAISHDIITQKGSWFSYGDNKLGQGVQNVIEFLMRDDATYKEIKEKSINKMKEG